MFSRRKRAKQLKARGPSEPGGEKKEEVWKYTKDLLVALGPFVREDTLDLQNRELDENIIMGTYTVTGTVDTMDYASPGLLVYSSGPDHEKKQFAMLWHPCYYQVFYLIKSVRNGLGSEALYQFALEGDLEVKLVSKDTWERHEKGFVTTIVVNRNTLDHQEEYASSSEDTKTPSTKDTDDPDYHSQSEVYGLTPNVSANQQSMQVRTRLRYLQIRLNQIQLASLIELLIS